MSQDPPTLPQEIVEDIVDYVAQDDFESLKAIARASRCYLERARRHLFRNVYLGDVLRLPPGTWKIFHKNPSLFKYARHLVVQARLPGFNVTESVLREVLGYITDLQGADIDVRWNYEKWSQFGIFDLCPDITHLSIHFSQVMPLTVFYSFPRLQELRITYDAHRPSSPENLESTLPTPPWHLKSLHYHISSVYHLPLLLAPSLDPHVYGGLGHLSLDVQCMATHGFLLSRILPACINSPLETLQLWYGGRFTSHRSYSTISTSITSC